MLRFMISAVGELRGPPMINGNERIPKNMSARYRETALAVLQKCLPVRPTPEFGAILHDTVLHLRLVNGAPFPSRNLGPWMTVFSRPNRGGLGLRRVPERCQVPLRFSRRKPRQPWQWRRVHPLRRKRERCRRVQVRLFTNPKSGSTETEWLSRGSRCHLASL